MKLIKYNKQFIDHDDKKAVLNSLSEEIITTGRHIVSFEKNLKKYFKSKFISCVNSGTSAIYIAIKSLSLKKNDIVIMPAINFIASYNCAKNLGLRVYFSDVDPRSGQSRPEDVENTIKKNNLKKVKLVISMYLGGQPDNVIEFFELKKKYNFILMEDACHAFGANYVYKNKKYKIGCSKHCDISTFSLHPLKSITTGEGGVISTNNKTIYKKINLLRSHGIARGKEHWNYDVVMNGYNFRMSDINASLGNSQLKKINLFIKNRKKIARIYIKSLNDFKNFCRLSINNNKKINLSAWHLLILSIDFEKLKINKNQLIKIFKKKKIILQVHYIPIYRFKIFKGNKKSMKKLFVGAEKYFKNSLSFPIFYKMKYNQVEYILNKLKNIINKNKKA